MATQKSTEKVISHYDPHIIPSESASRAEREGSHFCYVEHDDSTDIQHIHTRDGYTVDRDGLINNYAVEPPMYINEPGDLAEKEIAIAKKKADEYKALSEDEEGKLTLEYDKRHKGPGMI